MQQLKINIRPIFPFIVTWFGSATITIWLLTKFVGKPHPIISILIALIIVTVTQQLAKRIFEGKLIVSVSNKTMSFAWKRKPLLTTRCFEEINLQSISSYRHTEHRGFTSIKIILSDGANIKIECKTPNTSENTDLKKLVGHLKRVSQKNKYH
jgi:L-lactate permease